MRVGVQKKERKSEERASLSVGGLVDWPSRNDETKNTRVSPSSSSPSPSSFILQKKVGSVDPHL